MLCKEKKGLREHLQVAHKFSFERAVAHAQLERTRQEAVRPGNPSPAAGAADSTAAGHADFSASVSVPCSRLPPFLLAASMGDLHLLESMVDAHDRDTPDRSSSDLKNLPTSIKHDFGYRFDEHSPVPLVPKAKIPGTCGYIDALTPESSPKAPGSSPDLLQLHAPAQGTAGSSLGPVPCIPHPLTQLVDKSRSPALHWAAGNGHLHCLRFLLRHGADLHARNAGQGTKGQGARGHCAVRLKRDGGFVCVSVRVCVCVLECLPRTKSFGFCGV